MEVARLDRVTYWYPGGAAALEAVTIRFDAGPTLVHGPSGGGKSTLLRVLDGLVPHFYGGRWQGRATVLGIDILKSTPAALAATVGFVFQDPERQSVAATVEGEVAFALENRGVEPARIRPRVEEALEKVGAAGLWGRRLAELSGGERQRVQLAAAIALRPPVLVLDEPCSQLDPDGARAVGEAVATLAGAGVAVVFAEHRPEHLAATRSLLVEAGRVAEAPPRPSPAPARRPAALAGVAWELDAAVVGFRGRPLLEATLSGRAGEVVALVGPNGGGKTTLLRTLAGLLPPLGGAVRRASGRVAYLPQDPTALLHRPTVAAEVRWTLELAGRPHAPGDVAAELARQGVEEMAGRYPRDLSGGQRERAALAAVMAGAPVLALLDEPTRGMDARARDLLLAAVDRLTAAGGSVVIATHDRGLAAVADRVIEVGAGAVRPARGPA